MPIIRTKRGQEIHVDKGDFEELSKSPWYVEQWGYAARKVRHPDGSDRWTCEKMHRRIMGLRHGDRREVDHVNGNRLDNRRCNLRICDSGQNKQNTKIRSDNTSGYKGVHLHKPGQWRARIKLRGKFWHLGLFDAPEKAHAAYCAASKSLFGEFANDGRPSSL